MQFFDPFRHAIDLADDIPDVFAGSLASDLKGQFGTGANNGEGIAQVMSHDGRHLVKQGRHFVVNILLDP
ncbi:hypothetical protein D3C72_1811020 [compost metagenome]